MQAAADPCSPACLEDGSCVAVLSTDGGGKVTRFQVLSRLSPPTASGCAYVAAPWGGTSAPAGDAQPHVVLKVAPAPELAVQARRLHLPPEPWSQVCAARHASVLMVEVHPAPVVNGCSEPAPWHMAAGAT